MNKLNLPTFELVGALDVLKSTALKKILGGFQVHKTTKGKVEMLISVVETPYVLTHLKQKEYVVRMVLELTEGKVFSDFRNLVVAELLKHAYRGSLNKSKAIALKILEAKVNEKDETDFYQSWFANAKGEITVLEELKAKDFFDIWDRYKGHLRFPDKALTSSCIGEQRRALMYRCRSENEAMSWFECFDYAKSLDRQTIYEKIYKDDGFKYLKLLREAA